MDVFLYKGGATERERNDMVKVEVIAAAALHTSAPVAFPYCDLDVRGYETLAVNAARSGRPQLSLGIEFESKLENLSSGRVLLERTDKPKRAVVNPNPCPNLLVNPNPLGRSFTCHEIFGRMPK